MPIQEYSSLEVYQNKLIMFICYYALQLTVIFDKKKEPIFCSELKKRHVRHPDCALQLHVSE